MDKIKDIVSCVCLAAIAVSLMDTISHGRKLRNQLRLLFSGLIIITVLSAIVNSDFSFEIPTFAGFEDIDEIEALNSLSDDMEEREIERSLSKTLNSYLLSEGIIADKILFDVNITDETSIEISKTEVVLPDNMNVQEVKNTVYSLFGDIRCEIEVAGE